MQWFSGSIPDAIAEAKKKNKLFLVYVEGRDDLSREMTNTYNDNTVVQKLSSTGVIALKLDATSPTCLQFSAIYPVLIIPSSYFIGRNGVAIEIVTGSLQPAEFCAKVDGILEVHNKQIPSNQNNSNPLDQPSTSAASPVSESEATSTTSAIENDKPSTSNNETEKEKQPLADRCEKAKALIEERKQKRAHEEQEKELKDEIERRNAGKAIQQAENKRRELEMQEWAKNRAKEKEEERLAREKVKAQIAQDRAERAARYQQMKDEESSKQQAQAQARLREEQERAARSAAMNSNDARLQFRLPDGSFSSHTFSADSTLEDARRYVIDVVRPSFSNFTLCTTFPRRHFTEPNYAETLRDLQLAPSAVLLILPVHTVANVNSNAGFLSNIFWILVSPFTTLWRMFTSLFPRQPPGPSTSPPREAAASDEQPGPSGINLTHRGVPKK